MKGAILVSVGAKMDAQANLPGQSLAQSAMVASSFESPTAMAQQVYSNLHWHRL
jgi:hypothetical protein